MKKISITKDPNTFCTFKVKKVEIYFLFCLLSCKIKVLIIALKIVFWSYFRQKVWQFFDKIAECKQNKRKFRKLSSWEQVMKIRLNRVTLQSILCTNSSPTAVYFQINERRKIVGSLSNTVKSFALNNSDALKFLQNALIFWSENLRKWRSKDFWRYKLNN